ncbi:MAG: hypothetical protein JWN17_2449 [Frankiales bacterium]|nr:hypothetical protein [Frankiales bacterium]
MPPHRLPLLALAALAAAGSLLGAAAALAGPDEPSRAVLSAQVWTEPVGTGPAAAEPVAASGPGDSPRPCHPQPPAAASPVTAGGSVQLVVVVGATTVVRSQDGAPVSARTTTGQAPCSTDAFVDEAGTPVTADVQRAVLADVVAAGLDDDAWQPGTWRPLTR